MEGQEYHVRDMLILDEDRKKKVKFGKDTFVLKAPFPDDHKDISRRLAIEYNGLPVNSYSLDDRYLLERDVSLDVLIDDSPDWWSTANMCPDDTFKDELYKALTTWASEFQEKLKKNKFAKRGKEKSVSA